MFFVDKFANNAHNKNVAENELSKQIIALLEHYKQKDPLGLPGAPVPDPFPVPYTKVNIVINFELPNYDNFLFGAKKISINPSLSIIFISNQSEWGR